MSSLGFGKQTEKDKEDEKLAMEIKDLKSGEGKKRGRPKKQTQKDKEDEKLAMEVKAEKKRGRPKKQTQKDKIDEKLGMEIKELKKGEGKKKGKGIIGDLLGAIGLGKVKIMQKKIDEVKEEPKEGGKINKGIKIYRKTGAGVIGGNVKTANAEIPSKKILGEGKAKKKPNEYITLMNKLRKEKPELKTVKQLANYIKTNNLYNKK